ncbi:MULTISPECIES: DUF5783 family protein [Halolamina]|uniref:Uncharacterized protein n=1 Tax=Halolamina pelagica TaxID=699431 RepID=A0A1I5QCG2_9EURY|nr:MULTISPECIES: DUF5783 family protein [Halolamina]NHX35200.1 hypothetical protein [Halolamina sp. R1-12]SFP43945.1 hypothetical protein SAMN05216277_103361 [Halolamina pelagica]
MAEFDPETFEEEKYTEHFTQLQRAYKNAFETMSEDHDSDLIHAIDQQVLNESEPHFVDGAFEVELPEDPSERVTAVSVDAETVNGTLDRYTDVIAAELHDLLGVEQPETDG